MPFLEGVKIHHDGGKILRKLRMTQREALRMTQREALRMTQREALRMTSEERANIVRPYRLQVQSL
jgi:hypothetical protein